MRNIKAQATLSCCRQNIWVMKNKNTPLPLLFLASAKKKKVIWVRTHTLREFPLLVCVHQQNYSISIFEEGCLPGTPASCGFTRPCQLQVSDPSILAICICTLICCGSFKNSLYLGYSEPHYLTVYGIPYVYGQWPNYVHICHGVTPASSQSPCSLSLTPRPVGSGRKSEG